MLIPEEQPAQPALPVQPDGTRVVCGHCGNTFLVSKAPDSPSHLTVLSLKLFVISTFKRLLSHSMASLRNYSCFYACTTMDVWSVFGYLYMHFKETFNYHSVHAWIKPVVSLTA